MSKVTCPVCEARVPLPKRRRPLSGPGPGRACESPLCPNCDTDLSEQIAEHHAHRKKRKLGVFAKSMIAFVILGFLCIAGGITVLGMDPDPPWAPPVEQGFMVGTQVFFALALLMKLAYKLFEESDRLG